MDTVNERRIMKILNNECSPHNIGHGKPVPQYFVVTPKLLPDLEYSVHTTVFIIFNGPFQMSQRNWSMNKFLDAKSPGFTQKYQSTQTQNDVMNLYTQNNGVDNSNDNNNNNNVDSDEDDDVELVL